MAYTYSQIGERLSDAENKYQKNLENPSSKAQANSAKLMLERIRLRKNMLIGENNNHALLEEDKLRSLANESSFKAYKDLQALRNEKVKIPVAGIMNLAGLAGTFVDNLANKNMLDKMQAPVAPVYQNGVKLNTSFNIEPQLNDIRQQGAAFDTGVDNNLTSRASAVASKLSSLSTRISGISQLRAQKQNAENEMRNRETALNSEILAKNNAMGNSYRQSLVDFNNAKAQAGSANMANFGQDLMDINNDYISNVVIPQKQMEILMPYLNRYGVVDRKYAAMSEADSIFGNTKKKNNGTY